jgi:hypothetical protein
LGIAAKGVEGMSNGGLVEEGENPSGDKLNQLKAIRSLARYFSRDKRCEYRVSIASSIDNPSEILMIAWRTWSSSWMRI